jgi:hypothetical protein
MVELQERSEAYMQFVNPRLQAQDVLKGLLEDSVSVAGVAHLWFAVVIWLGIF